MNFDTNNYYKTKLICKNAISKLNNFSEEQNNI